MKQYNAKSIFVIMVLSIILVLEIVFYLHNNYLSISSNKVTSIHSKHISEEEYIRTIRLLLFPSLEKEVQNRYGEYAHVNSYDMDIDSIVIEASDKIIVDIIFRPFIGAHNTISTDKATFQIDYNEVKIIKYDTIER
ncbi:MAG: hypothetical protein K0S47_3337 [Herbinix sp.]|jgi:hypothetical protein|nr:hypothetical protein [Herbinix sp.]